MSKNLGAQWQPSKPESLTNRFSRLGWIGFLIQLVLLAVPVLLLIYVLFISGPKTAQRKGIDLSNYMSYGSLLVMIFTTFWFFRYTQVAKLITDAESCPSQASLMRILWIGVWASCLGIAFSVLLMMNTVGRMLFVLMATPQTGIPVAPALGAGDPTKTLSAIDAVSLTSLLITLAAELIVLGFSLWLLFRVTRPSAETAESTA